MTRPEDRIPIGQKLAFCLGGNMDYVATMLLTSVLWMPVFNIGMGFSPVFLGIILMVFRSWDAITDPIIGNISDNARTRWGRRKPFIVAGAILCGVLFPAFWHLPSGLGQTGQLIYLALLGVVFFTCFTLWSMPYYALQMELTPDYDERTRLNAWGTAVNKISFLGGSWVLALISSSWFADEETGKPDIVNGIQTISWVIGVLIVLLGVLPAIFTKERSYAAMVSTQPKEGFWKSVRDSLSCLPLWPLIGITFFLVMGYMSVSSLTSYIYIYKLHGGDVNAGAVLAGWRSTANVVFGLASIPLLTWLSIRYDKRAMVICMLLLCLFGHLLHAFFLSKGLTYLVLIPSVFESCGISAVWLFLPSMKADTADFDEISTYRRREGSINAFYSWFVKAALTASVGLGGAVLQISAFDPQLEHQPPEVLSSMLTLFFVLPAVCYSLAIACAFAFPLSRSRMESIRASLESRRGKI